MSETTSTPELEGRSLPIRLVLGGLAAAALALFVVQNTGKVPVKFLWMDGNFSLSVLLLVTVVLTLIIAVVVTWLLRRRD